MQGGHILITAGDALRVQGKHKTKTNFFIIKKTLRTKGQHQKKVFVAGAAALLRERESERVLSPYPGMFL